SDPADADPHRRCGEPGPLPRGEMNGDADSDARPLSDDDGRQAHQVAEEGGGQDLRGRCDRRGRDGQVESGGRGVRGWVPAEDRRQGGPERSGRSSDRVPRREGGKGERGSRTDWAGPGACGGTPAFDLSRSSRTVRTGACSTSGSGEDRVSTFRSGRPPPSGGGGRG